MTLLKDKAFALPEGKDRLEVWLLTPPRVDEDMEEPKPRSFVLAGV
jgi:hypothetical protein